MRKVLGLVVMGIIILTGCSQESENQKVTLMLDYTPNTNHTGIYVADSLGYYEDAGIDLEIIQPGDTAPNAAVASSAVDFGISYGEDVAMYNQPDDYQIISIMSILSTNTSGIVSNASKNITRPKQFEGKNYCGWGSDMETALIKSLVEADGGDFDKVNMLVATPNLTDENSQCDLVWTYEAWDNIMMEQEGIEFNYVPFTDYTVDWYTPILITSQSLIDSDPKLVKSFTTATIKGYEYAAENPEEAADIFLAAVPESDADLVKESQQFISPYYIEANGQVGYQDSNIWTTFIDWMKENKMVDDNLDPQSLYSNDFI